MKVLCDNNATVWILNSGRGRCPVMLSCARKLWYVTTSRNISMQVSHMGGKSNCRADELSRAHLNERSNVKIEELATKLNASFVEMKGEYCELKW